MHWLLRLSVILSLCVSDSLTLCLTHVSVCVSVCVLATCFCLEQIEDQAAGALARRLLQIDPNINTGPHGHAAHIAVRSFGARSAQSKAPVNAHRASAEVEFLHRLDVPSPLNKGASLCIFATHLTAIR